MTFAGSTAAIHYQNGTVVQVAQVDADPDYVVLMMESVNPPKPQPQTDRWERLLSWIDWKLRQLIDDYAEPPRYSPLERWRRWWNKRNGQPATDKTSILSRLLRDLKNATEAILGQPIDRVAFTSPSLAGLMTDDVNDALEFLGLRSWIDDSDYYPDHILEADAVYAANGYGLCNNYHDLFEYWDEFEGQFAPEILFISFSNHLLYTAIFQPEQGVALGGSYSEHDIQLMDFTQGNMLPAAFWDRVRQHILGLPWEYPLTHVLLAGESANHDQFRAVVVDALAELSTRFPQTNTQDYRSLNTTINSITAGTAVDPTFAAARGAALYARRRQEVQGGCTESTRCESYREEQRKKGPEHVHEKVQDEALAFDRKELR